MTLLYSDNGSGLNSADKIKSMASVGATQITLTQDNKHHLLALHVDCSGLESLWRVVCGSAGSAIHTGLLALRLQGGVTVWLSSGSSSSSGGGGGGGGSTKVDSHTQTTVKQEKSGTGERRGREGGTLS